MNSLKVGRPVASALLLSSALAATLSPLALADGFPPDWGTGAVHYQPAPWPSEPANPADCLHSCDEWLPYQRFKNDLNDPRVQDPSNGGTAPQNYVNVSSSCVDKTAPSIYYRLYQPVAGDPTQDVIMFRWRVEQIAHNYGGGAYGSTDPWSSALWTVLFDVDGDGFRDIAAHLNGSSGSPGEKIDLLAGIWGNIPTQSINYLEDPNIHLIAHNPTGFTQGSFLLNFQNALNPTTNWGNAEALNAWDYGTTRARRVSTNACNEYFVDYQIPVAMLDATALGGPKITRTSPISMLFCTANSLNNPFQKDCALNKAWAADASLPAPFGDYLSFNKPEPYQQPIVASVTATGPGFCPGTYTLTAKIQDTLAVQSGVVLPSVQEVYFYYWHDADGDGTTAGDAASAWTRISTPASLVAGTLNTWRVQWDANSLLKGRYLVGVQALDDNTKVDDGMTPTGVNNRTFSYLTGDSDNKITTAGVWVAGQQAAFPGHSPSQSPVVTENWWGNPDVTGLQTAVVGTAINACGIAPSVSKVVGSANVTTGELFPVTLTVANPVGAGPLTLTGLQDELPAGFTLKLDGGHPVGGTLGGSVLAPLPADGASGTVQFNFNATITAGASETLTFYVTAPMTVGTYNNLAHALTTNFGTVTSPPVAINVGSPRLTIAKGANPLAASPGGTVTYTITYGNDASVPVTNAVITDTLPLGLDYVPGSASNGGSYSAGTLTWNVGSLAAGEGPYTVTFQATVTNPYPVAATVPLVNTASIVSTETAPATASASIYVDTPRPALTLQKSVSSPLVAPGNQVTFTLSYANSGTGAASGVVIQDVLPPGFNFVSANPAASSAPAVGSNGTVTWNIGSVAASGSGSVQLVASVAGTYPATNANPATNNATIDSAETDPVAASAEVGVTQSGQLCTTYYLTDTQQDVGFAGTKYVGNTTVPGGASTTLQVFVPANPNPVPEIEVARFYQDPVSPYLVAFDGSSTLTGQIDYVKSSALGGAANSNLTLYVRLYDYDPTLGTETLLGSASYTDNGAPTPPVDLTAATPSGSLAKGHRLMWKVSVVMAQNKATTMELRVNSAGSNTQICAPAPANLVVNKSVTPTTASAGDALTYTLNYANTSGVTNATNAYVVDTLPSGVNYVSSSVAATSLGGNAYRFDLGTVNAGASGSFTINAAIDAGLSASVTSLTNQAYIVSDQTAATDPVTATTNIIGAVAGGGTPALVVQKRASKTLLEPGDVVTYYIDVLNAGSADATNVDVGDDMPDQAWFTYVAASIAGGDSRSDAADPLTWRINTLAPGASATLSFQMQMGGIGAVPSGLTTLNNAAAANCDEVPADVPSNSVTVTATTNPKLDLSKSVSGSPARPGEWLTWRVRVANIGGGDATGLVVYDPIPEGTSFVPASIVAQNGSATFDAVNNRIVFTVGTLPPGSTAAAACSDPLDVNCAVVTFKTEVRAPLAVNPDTIPNSASASASNATTVIASASASASASPNLTLTKSGPATLPLPAATLTADADNSTTLFVDSSARLTVGQAVRVGGTVTYVTALAGKSITLNAPVTAASGAQVLGSALYSITYQNSGDGEATNVQISDPLPAGFLFFWASSSASELLTGSPAVGSNGTVTWSLGTVAPGATGSVQVEAIPTAAGSFNNVATLTGDGGINVPDSFTTGVGGLVPRKVTATPVRSAGQSATYTITVDNTLAVAATNVTVKDLLPPGWTWATTTAITLGGAAQAAAAPSGDANQPVWGPYTIPANQSLVITFTANIPGSALPATYQNGVEAASGNAAVTPFDPLATTEEDVTILGSGEGVIEGYVYKDVDGDGSFDPAVDTPFGNIQISIADDVYGPASPYFEVTDGSGYFRRVVSAGEVTVTVDEVTLGGLAHNATTSNPDAVTVPDGGSASDLNGYINSFTTDVAVTKSNGATSLAYGGTTSYAVVVTNNGPSAANGTVVQDPAVAGISKSAVTCGSASGGAVCPTVDVAALEAGVTIATLPAGGSLTFTVTANVTGAVNDSVTNSATATLPAGGSDSNPANNSGSDTDPIAANAADLALTKSNGATSVTAGASTVYQVVVTNNGPSAAHNATVSDPAATGLSKSAVSCSAAGGAVCPAVNVATLEAGVAIPTLPSGGSVTFSVTATVTAAAGQSVTNTATVAPPTGVTDGTPGNDSASDTDPVVPAAFTADVAVTKSNGVTSLAPGASTTYQVVVTNNGPASAGGTVVTDAAVAGLTKSAVTCGGVSGGAVCPAVDVSALEAGVAIPTLPAGGSLTFSVTATVTASGGSSVTNTAVAALPAGGTDPTPGNNSGSDSDPVVAPVVADLTVTKSNGAASVTAGGSTVYQVVVTNNGPSAADGATVTDPYAAGLTKSAVGCSAAGGALCPVVDVATLEAGVAIPTFPAGGSVTFSVTATVVAAGGGSVTNSATAAVPPGGSDPTPGDNTGSDTDPVVSPIANADLSVTKSNGATSVTAGGTTTYSVLVVNGGPDAANGAVVSDPAVSGLSKTAVGCAASGGAVCPALSVASLEAGVAIPTFPAGGSLTLSVSATVTAAAGTTVTNVASVATPPGVADPTPGNNSGSDSDPVTASTNGTITGTVYRDNNADGLQNGGDTPLPGVSVRVTASDNTTRDLLTDAAGQFSASVPAGVTVVDVIESSAPLNGLVLTSDGSGQGSDPTRVTVPAGGTAADLTGYVPAAGATGAVSGVVFRDGNGNGLYDPGVDTPLAGVEIQVTTATGGLITVVTDNSGWYLATVPAGTTRVDVVDATLPPNLTLTTDSAGQGSDPTTVTVPAGGNASDNTGYVALTPGTPGVVSGTVYVDVNGDGLYTPGVDQPLAGVQVVITTSTGGRITVTTDAGGHYSAQVPPGTTYMDVVDSTLPPGLALTNNGHGEGSDYNVAEVPAGGSASDNTGYVPAPATGTLTGRVYRDIDADGRWSAGTDQPLPGVQVQVSENGGGLLNLLTDSQGSFSALVPAGNTTVDVVEASLPAGLALTSNGAGQGSDPTVVNVPAGGTASDLTGYVASSSLADVFTLVSMPASAATGMPVAAQVTFGNNGPGAAAGVTYRVTLGSPGYRPDGVSFVMPRGGSSASYDPATGVVSFSGLPGNLAAGISFTLQLTFTMHTAGTVPVASAITTTTGESSTANNSASAAVVFSGVPNVFDPPMGFKTVTPQGLPALLWRMVWINNGNAAAVAVVVTDKIPVGTSYTPGSLVCEPRGASVTTACYYDAVNNRVVWQGSIAADLGAMDEATAANEVVISFVAALNDGVTSATNTGEASWDDDGDGVVDDDIAGGQIPQPGETAIYGPGVHGAPLMPIHLMALMYAGVMGFGLWRLRGRRR